MSRRRPAAGAQRRRRAADPYEDMGDLAGFPTVYDHRDGTWIVTINGERQRFDPQAVVDTTRLMYELYQDGRRRGAFSSGS